MIPVIRQKCEAAHRKQCSRFSVNEHMPMPLTHLIFLPGVLQISYGLKPQNSEEETICKSQKLNIYCVILRRPFTLILSAVWNLMCR